MGIKVHAPVLGPDFKLPQVLLKGKVVTEPVDLPLDQALGSIGRSWMWQMNNKGPSTVPWGTSESMIDALEVHPSTTTCMVRSV